MKLKGQAPTIIALLAANLVVLALQVTQGWSPFTLFWIYWIQGIIIGFFMFLKILDFRGCSEKATYVSGWQPGPIEKGNISTAFFFALTYGFAHYCLYTFFIGATAWMEDYALILGGQSPQRLAAAQPLNAMPWILIPVAVFLANHYYSYRYYKNKDRPEKKHSHHIVLAYCYARIIPMYVIGIAGVFMIKPEMQASAVSLFVVLKTCADLIMHYIEHHEGWI
jgi:hypothetical protein